VNVVADKFRLGRGVVVETCRGAGAVWTGYVIVRYTPNVSIAFPGPPTSTIRNFRVDSHF